MSQGCPVIDIAAARAGGPGERRRIAAEIDAALRRIGFFVVTGHGVDPALLQAAVDAGRRFFDLPEAEKLKVRNQAKGSPRGYLAYGRTTVGATYGQGGPPDLKESYGIGPEVIPQRFQGLPYYAANVWSPAPADFRDRFVAYYGAMEGLSADLLSLFATALWLPDDFFMEKFDGHNSTLRVLNYPELTEAPLPGQVRAGAHSDYGALTILLIDRARGGLEVQTRDGAWIPVTGEIGGFVVNIGDLMMRWTNDVWVSSIHRVVNPEPGDAGKARRQSIAYFANPRENVLIDCIETCRTPGEAPRHPPVLAGEHRLSKIRASMPEAPAGA